MKLINRLIKIAMLLFMLIGTIFSIFTIVSFEVKAKVSKEDSETSKGVWIIDEITGDSVCMGTGTECEQKISPR